MAEAQAGATIVQQIMNNPTVFMAGAVVGVIGKMIMGRNKNQGMGFQ